MTDEELAALMTDMTFRGRIKVSALRYADVLLNKPLDTFAINVQRAYAKRTQQMPDTVAQELQPTVVMDPAVQAAGKGVTDAALQGAVEAAINRSF